MGHSQTAAFEILDAHGLPRLGGAAVGNVTGENPRMAGFDPFFPSSGDANGVHAAASLSNRAMRSSVAGCVEKRRIMLWPERGLMMYMCDMEGEASMGMRCE